MIKIDIATLKLMAICAIGIFLNVIGNVMARNFELSVYLDSFGTIFIAALGGYVPGIAVGFFTNLVGSGLNVDDMYFSFVSILVAITAAFFAQKGYFEKFSKVLLIIPAIVLLSSIFGVLIEELLTPMNTFHSLERIQEHFVRNLMIEVPDKSLAILASFFLLKIIPPDVKESFRLLGRKQAPVTAEMNSAIRAQSKWVSSLRTKMVFILLSITLLVAVFISAISYRIYQDSAINERIRIADGIISMVVSEINPNRVDEYLELGRKAPGYNEVERNLYKIRSSNHDIKFLYVYKIEPDGCHVIFDLETASVKASAPGDVEEFDESFEPYLDDLLAGRPIQPIINNDTYGYLLTIYKPVYNHQGHCVCYAGIDFSMDMINDYGRTFIMRVIALFSGVVILILAFGLSFIENNIILPVNTMAYCARNFAYESEAERSGNIARIKSLAIQTNDEIENLYSAFVKTTSDSMHYFENLRKAKIQVAVMDELAHTDSLTGIKNKTAYIETTTRLDAEIAEGRAAFAIIMIDVNYLKRVNDTYGHERGNEYLINACKLTCSIFGKENVYRVGGDEFVAVLDGENLARCEKLIAKIRNLIKKFKDDATLEPWEKVSAAVGVGYYQAGVDKNAEEVFKRADEQMYANKLAMKATRKD